MFDEKKIVHLVNSDYTPIESAIKTRIQGQICSGCGYNCKVMAIKRWKIKLHIVLFTFTRIVVNTNYRMVYPFLPVFARGLGIEPASLALAFSIRSFLSVFGPFLATIADTHDRRTGILMGAGLFTLGSGLVGLSPTFWGFIGGISLASLGNVVFIPSMNAYLGDQVSYEKRGRVMAITEMSWALAFIAGIPVVRWLLESYAWFSPFYIFTGLGLVFFVLYWFMLPARSIPKTDENTIWRNLGRVLKTWPAVAGLLVGVLATGANETVNVIFGVWIENQFGINFAALTTASIVIGISELGGEVATGLWLDAVGKRKMIWIFLGLNSLAALLLPLGGRSMTWALAGLGFFFISFEIILVGMLTLMSEVVPAARATMMAMTVAGFSLGRMLGDLISPSFYSIGFGAVCLATIVLNFLAASLLTQVKVGD